MNTIYQLRFTKIIIGKDEYGEDIVEFLISDLPMDEYSIDDLKELYHLRWTIEQDEIGEIQWIQRDTHLSGYLCRYMVV